MSPLLTVSNHDHEMVFDYAYSLRHLLGFSVSWGDADVTPLALHT